MDIVVIGGTGHIGTFLVPRLVRGGHRVRSVSRGERRPYQPDEAWQQVERIRLDRDAAERDGTFGTSVADLAPEVVIDLTCFTEGSARALLLALGGRVQHLVHCGTLWTHGPAMLQPVPEDDPDRQPVGEYGTAKLAIERLLLAQSADGVPSTVIHPGHISGPGWPVINPVGNLDPRTWQRLARGESLPVPGLGTEILHHVHADDVAQLFELAVEQREAGLGHAFHAVAARALTVRGFATAAAAWWGRRPRLQHVTWEAFGDDAGEEQAGISWEHLSRSIVGSIELGRSLLGYQPRYSAEDAARQAVAAMVEAGTLDVPAPA